MANEVDFDVVHAAYQATAFSGGTGCSFLICPGKTILAFRPDLAGTIDSRDVYEVVRQPDGTCVIAPFRKSER